MGNSTLKFQQNSWFSQLRARTPTTCHQTKPSHTAPSPRQRIVYHHAKPPPAATTNSEKKRSTTHGTFSAKKCAVGHAPPSQNRQTPQKKRPRMMATNASSREPGNTAEVHPTRCGQSTCAELKKF